MKVVHVKWKDPGFSENSWMSESRFKEWAKEDVVQCESVGLLAYETEFYIVLIQSVGDELIASALKISRAAIQSVQEIGEVPIMFVMEDDK